MQASNKGDGFAFRRNNFATSSNSSTTSDSSFTTQNCRRRLKEQFDETEPNASQNIKDRSVLSVLNLSDTRRVFRTGAEKITKTFNNVRTTLGTISQRFKLSTKRRQILQEGPMTPGCVTPHTFSKQVLGRTPTKLYSPFGIETPFKGSGSNKENLPATNPLIEDVTTR